MRGTTIALCFVLALSCGSAAVHGQASDAVNALSEERRAEVMRQLIESADYPCGRVARVFFKGENSYNDTANYTVRCDADSDYIVSIENRGQMGASDCVMVRLIGDDCWAPF